MTFFQVCSFEGFTLKVHKGEIRTLKECFSFPAVKNSDSEK